MDMKNTEATPITKRVQDVVQGDVIVAAYVDGPHGLVRSIRKYVDVVVVWFYDTKTPSTYPMNTKVQVR